MVLVLDGNSKKVRTCGLISRSIPICNRFAKLMRIIKKSMLNFLFHFHFIMTCLKSIQIQYGQEALFDDGHSIYIRW